MKIAAFGKQSGFIQAHGNTREEVMTILRQIGDCEESDFDWIKITDRLAEAVDEFGCQIPMKKNDEGILDTYIED